MFKTILIRLCRLFLWIRLSSIGVWIKSTPCRTSQVAPTDLDRPYWCLNYTNALSGIVLSLVVSCRSLRCMLNVSLFDLWIASYQFQYFWKVSRVRLSTQSRTFIRSSLYYVFIFSSIITYIRTWYVLWNDTFSLF